MKKTVKIRDGIFYIDDKPVFLVSADYPYYRDGVENWADRLRKIKAAGIDTVTFYAPWRHHMIKNGEDYIIDFDGRTQPNRNVKLFLRLCAKSGLKAIVKPGPFVHAELNYGGLPDWVSPDDDPEIEPFLDHKGRPHRWPRKGGKILPAPLGKKFKAQVKDWYKSVDENLIRGNVYPKGSIIAAQVLNEGIYSDSPAPINSYDYSDSSISLYRKFRGSRKSMLPKTVSEIKTKPGLKELLYWGEWQAQYMKTIYKEYCSAIKSDVPFIININPPAAGRGLDQWLARIIPERWPMVNYGFTNWLMPVSEDASSFEQYSLSAKRKRGINLEENWGFSKLYDRRFKYSDICVFETLLAVANGATGFNVYTAANTASWDDSIDNSHGRPYPDSSPIKEDGSLTKKYKALKALVDFFKQNGVDLLESRPVSSVAWGLYPPYACLAAWNIPERQWRKLRTNPVRCGYEGLEEFQRLLRQKNMDYGIINIESASPAELSAFQYIVLCGGFFMDRKTQRKLSGYITSGGKLIFIGETPFLDENFKKYAILKDKAVLINAIRDVFGAIKDFARKLRVLDPDTQVWAYENQGKGIQFFFVFNLADRAGVKEFIFEGRYIKINLPQKSAAVIKVRDSKLNSVFVKEGERWQIKTIR